MFSLEGKRRACNRRTGGLGGAIAAQLHRGGRVWRVVCGYVRGRDSILAAAPRQIPRSRLSGRENLVCGDAVDSVAGGNAAGERARRIIDTLLTNAGGFTRDGLFWCGDERVDAIVWLTRKDYVFKFQSVIFMLCDSRRTAVVVRGMNEGAGRRGLLGVFYVPVVSLPSDGRVAPYLGALRWPGRVR